MNVTCVKPEISAYDFMRYLCAALVKKNKIIIDLNTIVDQIYSYKKDKRGLTHIFEDIEFRNNVDKVISYDIAEGINALQTFGVVGKLNPSYEKLVIYLTQDEADTILSLCSADIKQVMLELASEF